MKDCIVCFSLEPDRLDSEVGVDLDSFSRIVEYHDDLMLAQSRECRTYKGSRHSEGGNQRFEDGQSLLISTGEV